VNWKSVIQYQHWHGKERWSVSMKWNAGASLSSCKEDECISILWNEGWMENDEKRGERKK